MKFSKLKEIVTNQADTLKDNAGYSGSHNDGGCSNLLAKLDRYEHSLIVKYDYRPSEYYNLLDVEVGEPEEFYEVIKEFKIKLAENIKL